MNIIIIGNKFKYIIFAVILLPSCSIIDKNIMKNENINDFYEINFIQENYNMDK